MSGFDTLLSGSMLQLLALMVFCLLVTVVALGWGLWDTIRAARALWREIRGAPQPAPRMADDLPLRLPPGIDPPDSLARPGAGLRLGMSLLALVLIPGFAWQFDVLFYRDPARIGFWLWAAVSLVLLWYVLLVWSWQVRFDDQGLSVSWLGQPGRRQEWRDLVLMTSENPFSCVLHFAKGPSLTLLRPLVGGERLFQMAEGHLFRGSNARAARG